MVDALAIALPLTVGAVLIASGVAKLRTPDELSSWTDLGVPRPLRREWLRRLHPWGELALGASVMTLGGALGGLAGVVAFVLMLAYTLLVARVATGSTDASCACFGDRRRVTGLTVVRNAWLTATALGTTLVVWTTPTLGGALLAGLSQPDWLVALVVPAITAVLILWRESDGVEGDRGVPDLSATGSADLDYIRTRTPAIPVTLADGAIANLRALSVTRPMLLLAVSPYCGSCDGVHAQRKTWRALLPEVDVRLVLDESPADSSWTEGAEPQSLHDENDYVRDSLGYVSTPSAVLLGADGMLAGGPVTGDIAIERFVDDIYESLHGERPARVDSPA